MAVVTGPRLATLVLRPQAPTQVARTKARNKAAAIVGATKGRTKTTRSKAAAIKVVVIVAATKGRIKAEINKATDQAKDVVGVVEAAVAAVATASPKTT